MMAEAMNEEEWPALTGNSESPDVEWEMLKDEESSHSCNNSNTNNSSFEVVGVPPEENTANIPHCQSTPNFMDSSLLDSKLEGIEEEQDSFELVSGVGSVWTSTHSVSFKEAILSPKTSVTQHTNKVPAPVPRKQRNRIQPKFLVVTPKRCSKSTGDLQKLLCEEYDEEYYDLKSMGSTSYHNSQKLRPDEAKRRQHIINKKQHQRQKQEQGSKQ